MGKSIHVGRYVGSPAAGGGLRFLCDAPELEPHADRPWFRAYAAERLDLPPTAVGAGGMGGDGLGAEDAGAPSGAALVGHDLLARHACVCGATGSGKTRLALHLLSEQIKAGCSVVMLDPKIETIRHLLALAYAAGLAPEQVTVLSPHLSGAGAPGWNPLDARASGVPPAQAAADVVSVLAQSTGSWGPRMGDLLANALIVVASHGLSLFELARLLQRDDYREGLLRKPLPGPGNDAFDGIAFDEARDYFLSEFAAWSRSERASAAAPVLNKFRELLRTPFLRSLLCARRTTLHLGALWHRPGLVLVHLDSAALGDEGVRLLGGLLAHQLLRTAMRADGPVPVVLALDEMGVSEGFVGGAAAKILAIARSRGLRLLVACQHLDQLSGELRAALLANTAVQAFFRLGYADARLVAASLSAGTGERVSRVAADVGKRDADGLPEAWASATHTVRGGQGEPVALSPAASQAFWHLARQADGAAQVAGLKRLALVSGVGRLYVHAADTKRPVELARYLKGLAPGDYRLVGAGPVRLVVAFPRPRLSVLARETEAERGQRWVKALTELPVRGAVLWLATGRTGTVQVAEVADPGALPGFDVPGFERFLSASVAGSGQSAREVAQAQAWRREEVEHIAGGSGPDRRSVGAPSADSTVPVRPIPPKEGSWGRAASTTRQSERSGAHEPGSGRLPAPLAAGTAGHGMKVATGPTAGPTVAEDGSLA